ncbi:hypothetical protein FPV67DRAFT_1444538 [Lyophyllum atratum]|nr:hypothetical protein FPV67DRAFT_1444538 [Lyophyllum atratum]
MLRTNVQANAASSVATPISDTIRAQTSPATPASTDLVRAPTLADLNKEIAKFRNSFDDELAQRATLQAVQDEIKELRDELLQVVATKQALEKEASDGGKERRSLIQKVDEIEIEKAKLYDIFFQQSQEANNLLVDVAGMVEALRLSKMDNDELKESLASAHRLTAHQAQLTAHQAQLTAHQAHAQHQSQAIDRLEQGIRNFVTCTICWSKKGRMILNTKALPQLLPLSVTEAWVLKHVDAGAMVDSAALQRHRQDQRNVEMRAMAEAAQQKALAAHHAKLEKALTKLDASGADPSSLPGAEKSLKGVDQYSIDRAIRSVHTISKIKDSIARLKLDVNGIGTPSVASDTSAEDVLGRLSTIRKASATLERDLAYVAHRVKTPAVVVLRQETYQDLQKLSGTILSVQKLWEAVLTARATERKAHEAAGITTYATA